MSGAAGVYSAVHESVKRGPGPGAGAVQATDQTPNNVENWLERTPAEHQLTASGQQTDQERTRNGPGTNYERTTISIE
jgi:hypothetical protein